MANYQPTYLGEIELSEDSLAHYGVKGMKWRKRKAKSNKLSKARRTYGKTSTIYREDDPILGTLRRDRSRKDTSINMYPAGSRRWIRNISNESRDGIDVSERPVKKKRRNKR